MPVPGRDRCARHTGRQGHRDRHLRDTRRRPVAQLADAVVTPGEDRTRGRQRDTERVARADGDRSRAARQRDRDGHRGVRVGGGVVAELSGRVVAPHIDAARRDREAVREARRDRRRGDARRQRDLCRTGRRAAARAELADVVRARGVHRARARQVERVRVAGRHRRRHRPRRKVHLRGEQRVGRLADAERAEAVVAPRPHGAVRGEREAVVVADRDLRELHAGRQARQCDLHRRGHRGGAAGARPELAVGVVAPRVDRTRRREREAVHVPSGDRRQRQTGRKLVLHRRRAAGRRRAQAQLTGVVKARTQHDAGARRGRVGRRVLLHDRHRGGDRRHDSQAAQNTTHRRNSLKIPEDRIRPTETAIGRPGRREK